VNNGENSTAAIASSPGACPRLLVAPESLLVQAKAFAQVVTLLTSLPANLSFGQRGLSVSGRDAETQKQSPKAGYKASNFDARKLPVVTLSSSAIECRGRIIYLGTSPLMLKLFKAFLKAPNHSISVNQLMEALYGRDELQGRSERYREGCRKKAVKLVSRARSILARHFTDELLSEIDWLGCQKRDTHWTLVVPRPGYMKRFLDLYESEDGVGGVEA
jgi:hypothetical protein